MNKKFLSAILFGALMVSSTGTFVSCKDYDDDIKNLQEQIDSQKSDLSTKVTAVETSISSLQSAQSSLQTEIANAKTEAQKAALAAQEAAVATAKAELEDVKSELQAAIAANTKDAETLKTTVAGIEETMTLSLGRIQALEAFKTTTEAALEALGKADQTLADNISELDETVIAQGKKITALEAQVKALEGYKGENTEAVNALKEKLADIEAGVLTEDMIKQIAEQVTEIAGSQLSVIEAAISKAVTFVTLTNPEYDGKNETIIASKFWTMDLRTAEAVEDRTFGKDEAEAAMYTVANQKEFKKGERAFLTDSVLIRVSPTNAVLTPQQITFVNSALGNLDELVTIEDVKPFKGTVTSRGISANGLWKVYFKLNKENYSEKAYLAAAKYNYSETLTDAAVKKLNDINYAVAVKDGETDTDRYVTSAYDLTLGSEYTPVYNLNFKVNDKDVDYIRNRFQFAEDNTWTMDASKNLLYDYAWNVNAENERVEKDGSYTHVDVDNANNYRTQNRYGRDYKLYYSYNNGDNRNDYNFFSAKVGDPFTVTLDYTDEQKSGIYGFYVVYDALRAVESNPSEINAWDSYEKEISGLNTITTSDNITLTVNAKAAEGDILGFRVYAVNYDGSLVDPDGKAFYVAVGDIKETTLSTTWTPEYNAAYAQQGINLNSKTIKFSDEILDLFAENIYGISNWTVDTENNPTNKWFNYELLDKDGNVTRIMKNVVGMRLVLTEPVYEYKDGGVYTATFNIMNNEKSTIARKVTVNLTKTMPEFPTIFSAKGNQLVNGVHTTVDFYTRSNWTTPYNLSQVFNGIVDVNGEGANDTHYTFKCADVKDAFTGMGDYGFELPAESEKAWPLIGGTYDVTVAYTYDGISSEASASDNYNYTVQAPAAKNFKLKLNCMETLTADWTNVDKDKKPIKYELTYGATGSTLKFGASFTVKMNDAKIDALDQFQTIKDGSLKLITTGANVEYFTVGFNGTDTFTFVPVVDAKRPASAVASTLQFVLVDFFGHETPISLPYVVVNPEAK